MRFSSFRNVLIVFLLLLPLSLFKTSNIDAQSCAGATHDCYKQQCDANFNCKWVYYGTLSCSSITVNCNLAEFGCNDSNGNRIDWFCSYPAPTPTPTPGGGGGNGGSCSGACFDGSSGQNCGTYGYNNGSGSCSAGQICCQSKSGGGPQPGPSQGAYVYCQDSGPAYPMAGIRVIGLQNQGKPWLTEITGLNGKAPLFQFANNVDYGAFIAQPGTSSPVILYSKPNGTAVANPLAPYPGYASRTLSTGQTYANLTVDPVDTKTLTSWNNPQWYWYCSTGCGRTQGFFLDWGPYGTSISYAMDIPSYASGEYGIVYRFRNCTPPPPPVAGTAWWQATGGDVITNGNLDSTIPTATCTLPACDPHLILSGLTPGIPGNAMYAGSSNITTSNSSLKGWLGKITYQGKTYDSAYFNNVLPSNIVFNSIGPVAVQANFNGGNVSPDGYYYYKSTGDLTINANITIATGRKIVVFVEGGNLIINGTINIQTLGQGFFMIIAGKDVSGNNGDITVNSNLTGAGGLPALEGIYESDGTFDTGNGTNQLFIRGTVVAWGGMNLKRDLAVNGATPAETFTYAPDQILLFPRSLIQDSTNWVEVAP